MYLTIFYKCIIYIIIFDSTNKISLSNFTTNLNLYGIEYIGQIPSHLSFFLVGKIRGGGVYVKKRKVYSDRELLS